jgi:urease accessory protein
MRVADSYVGNRGSEVVAARLAREGFETITVDDAERRRSRFRTTTGTGTDLGVTVSRELTAGDVLAAEDLLVVVELEPVETMVIDLEGAAGSLTGAVALGHAVGNRHWDMAVRGQEVLFPAPESDARTDATLAPHLPEGATVSRERVSPALVDGQVESASHAHGGGHSHYHGADTAHSHEQSHGDGQDGTAHRGGESQ